MFIISTSLVTQDIVAKIRGGIIRNEAITADNLCEHLKTTPLYDQFVDAKDNESLCVSIWNTYQYFRDSFTEYCILWERYLDAESLELIAAIKNCTFYRLLNDNFSIYNTTPTILPNGNKVFIYQILRNQYATIEESEYDNLIKSLMNNLVFLISLIDKLNKRIV